MTETAQREAVRELPPSAKLVYWVLKREGELNRRKIVEETMLSDRTTRYALERLKDAGVVEQRYSLSDARVRLYSVADG
jgi:DNA-binding transcriptional ArsR family regulator